MKLLRQVKLHFQEGKSDKVYEVDLVETAPGKHVVNFRYGRRGSNLRDGTKTVMPVDRATADGIFDTLVASKTSKGYRITSEEVQAPVLEVRGDAPPPPPADDSRARAILARLRAGGGDWPLHRVAWRAGDAGITAAVPLITAIPRGSLEDLFSYAWALGRLVPRLPADDPAIAPAVAMLDSAREPGKHEPRRWAAVARVATDGLIAIGDVHDPELAARERATIAARIPVELHALLDGGEPAANGADAVAAAEAALALRCREADGAGPGGKQRAEAFRELCLDLYLHRSLRARDAVIRLLPDVRLQGRVNQGLFRSLWKLAELRRDGRLFGAVVRRYERARAFTGDWIQPRHRKYFRRRAWRTLRKLGELASGDYTELAAGVCLAMSDDDGVYPWGMAHHPLAPEEAWDKYTRYWAFAQIVMGEDTRFTPDRKSLILRNPEPAPASGQAGRVERFPALWDRAPGHLLKLCLESRCGVVHAFAARALSFATEFLERFATADITGLLGAPYPPTSTLGLDCAVRRFKPADPDWELAVAAANSPLERARRQGWEWCGAGWDAVLADSAVLAALLTSPRSDTLQWCDAQLESRGPTDAVAQQVLARVIAELMHPGARDAAWMEQVADVTGRRLGGALRGVTWDVLTDLAEHPGKAVQLLALHILEQHPRFAEDPPEGLLAALLRSEHDAVRGGAVELFHRLTDAQLIERAGLVAEFATHRIPEMRGAAVELVARLSAASAELGLILAGACVEVLRRPKVDADRSNDLLALLQQQLATALVTLAEQERWRLLGAVHTAAQELGAEVLAQLPTARIGIPQCLTLANHPVLRARELAWAVYEAEPDRVRAELATAVRMLDAEWEDSRRFAAEYFRARFQPEDCTPDVVVAVCDSVRPEVQRFGHEILQRNFEAADGPLYVARLAEHPSPVTQQMVSTMVAEHAAGHPERIRALRPFFATVLAGVNRGRVAKERVWAFLRDESAARAETAADVAELVGTASATMSVRDRARAIALLNTIAARYPDIAVPVTRTPAEARGGV